MLKPQMPVVVDLGQRSLLRANDTYSRAATQFCACVRGRGALWEKVVQALGRLEGDSRRSIVTLNTPGPRV